jgi:hypothetical protein
MNVPLVIITEVFFEKCGKQEKRTGKNKLDLIPIAIGTIG